MSGGVDGRFPVTRHSVIWEALSEDTEQRRRGWDRLVAAYWAPVHRYIRVKWGARDEEAEDMTQGFFTRAIEKETVRNFDPARASFRTYLRTCVDSYVLNERKAAGRIKRGGGERIVSLASEDETGASPVEPAGGPTPEEIFEREWARSVFALALEELRSECGAAGKDAQFRIFLRYDVEGEDDDRPTYSQLAEEFGVAPHAITNYLAAMRRSFRKTVLNVLREMTASDREFRAEARALLGVDPA